MDQVQGAPRYSKLAELIKLQRQKHQVSQADLAAQFGCEETTIRRWETGKYRPAYTYQKKLTEFLGLSLEEFVSLISEEEQVVREQEARAGVSSSPLHPEDRSEAV